MALSQSGLIRTGKPAAQGDCEAWHHLDEGALRPSRSRKACMTCHWSGTGPERIPLLTCQLHQGLIGRGEHLVRCPGWTDDMARQRG
jgi:hypothetical protein